MLSLGWASAHVHLAARAPSHLRHHVPPMMSEWNAARGGVGLNGMPRASATSRPTTRVDSASARDSETAGRVSPTNGRSAASVLVQGGSLKTFSYRSTPEQLQVILTSEGRPVEADIELYSGPGNTPTKMRVYVEDGRRTPFSAVLGTPRGLPNTVAIRNIGGMVYPFTAQVLAEDVDQPSAETMRSSSPVQGGALRTYPFDPSVESVELLLTTDGRPLNARVELLQGPNNNKQIFEVYTEDGCDRPFFCILQTPGAGTVVRVVNTGPMEFPISASLVPHSIGQGLPAGDDEPGWDQPVLGGMGW